MELLDLFVVSTNATMEMWSSGSYICVQIQLLKLLRRLLVDESGASQYISGGAKNCILNTLFKTLTKIISMDGLYGVQRKVRSVKTSMSASCYTTLAEELLCTIRRLHCTKPWSDMINFLVWRKFNLLRGKDIHDDSLLRQEKLELLAAMAIVGGIDGRMRYGAYVQHPEYGTGTVADILPNGKISVYYAKNVKPKLSGHLKLEQVRYIFICKLQITIINFYEKAQYTNTVYVCS